MHAAKMSTADDLRDAHEAADVLISEPSSGSPASWMIPSCPGC
jgi:hypothetical protein